MPICSRIVVELKCSDNNVRSVIDDSNDSHHVDWKDGRSSDPIKGHRSHIMIVEHEDNAFAATGHLLDHDVDQLLVRLPSRSIAAFLDLRTEKFQLFTIEADSSAGKWTYLLAVEATMRTVTTASGSIIRTYAASELPESRLTSHFRVGRLSY